jgi:2-polyprenyl-3-methyl-5-hydroxy-6-metoxy-1,4-benzoquinol methylase
MDRLIKRFDAAVDGDLMLCEHRGVAYQRNMTTQRVTYTGEYLAHYDRLASTPMSAAINAARVALLARHAPAGCSVLDVGAASGTFVRAAEAAGFSAKGFDVIPAAVDRLKARDAFSTDQSEFDAVTMWDSLEHMDRPGEYLGRVRKGAYLMAAIPVVEDLRRVRESKHYKPGEHLYYWTPHGFIDFMALYGFRLLETSSHETDAGRESIGAFAFKRDLPDRRDHVAAYMEMHASRFYGASATELYLDKVAAVVKEIKPKSILDYGCGRSDLIAHFWRDGDRRLARFDPAIPAWKHMPDGTFDLGICCDVMEHVPMIAVDRVLGDLRTKTAHAFFAISTKLARAKLPDGRNAHVTLLRPSEWKRWIAEYFGPVREVPTQAEHELVLVAGVRP